jgi:predicted trehalose synthase
VHDISHSIAEQTSTSTTIAQRVEQIAQMAEENSSAASSSADAARELHKQARTILNTVAQYQGKVIVALHSPLQMGMALRTGGGFHFGQSLQDAAGIQRLRLLAALAQFIQLRFSCTSSAMRASTC